MKKEKSAKHSGVNGRSQTAGNMSGKSTSRMTMVVMRDEWSKGNRLSVRSLPRKVRDFAGALPSGIPRVGIRFFQRHPSRTSIRRADVNAAAMPADEKPVFFLA